MKRILALDYGQRRTGVAVSDLLQITAQGRPTIEPLSMKDLIVKILDLIENEDVEKVILGLPLNMNGSQSEIGREVEHLADRLRREASVPIELWDERLTSQLAEQTLIYGRTRRAKRKQKIDQLAAVLLLQNYLDAHPSS
ncbi:Holliday junction resolvase RuvX [bacterium]|nr:Holliday junction resolvase RuvX [bacterium]